MEGFISPKTLCPGVPLSYSDLPSCAGARFIVVLTNFGLMEKLRLSDAVLPIGDSLDIRNLAVQRVFSAQRTDTGPYEVHL